MRAGDTITDGGVVWKVIDTRVNGFIGEVPNFYERSELFVPNRTTITTPTKMMVNVNNKGYIGTAVTLNLNATASWDSSSTSYATAANRAGKDCYIYVCEQDGDIPKILLSANSTVPAGYNAATSRKIGGFHCLCLSVGTISGHQLSGYNTGDILPLSVWDLKHRPKSDPEGMVYVAGIGRWYDIYLASWNGAKLVSKYGGTVADGASSPNWHGEKFAEYIGLVGKQLMFRHEFMVVAKGSNELTNINGSRDYGTTGGHVDTANRRMISNYGLEDCCGFMWQWVNDTHENYLAPGGNATTYKGAYWNDAARTYLDGYSWQDAPVYSQSVDGETKYGSSGGLLRRSFVGGYWDAGSRCGSRSVYCDSFSAVVYGTIGARGSCEPA